MLCNHLVHTFTQNMLSFLQPFRICPGFLGSFHDISQHSQILVIRNTLPPSFPAFGVDDPVVATVNHAITHSVSIVAECHVVLLDIDPHPDSTETQLPGVP